ncbi:duboraya [Kryptolebias marmoratus]|uniref:duboraya n=1 Tax=Kryptolebias marmoratus TaxID=37003 RepID=UPI0007F8EEA0|nr:duboraya [Kryptolebias marmoratus]
MEEEAQPRPSVAELASRFKGSNPPLNNEADKPVRRRPPRTLQLPKPQGDDQEAPPPVTSPSKVKRNSALIEKLQANLALSPTAPLKSPGLRVLPLPFPPPSSGSTPTSLVTTPSSVTPTSPVLTYPQTEEGPASFEAPPSAEDGNILASINKGRARVSIRRRPPSRRHRKSSGGDEVSDAADTERSSRTEGEEKTGGGEEEGGGGGGDEVFRKDVQTDSSSSPDKNEEEEMKISEEGGGEEASSSSHTREEEEGGSPSSHTREEEEGGSSSSHTREEEEGGSSSSHLREEDKQEPPEEDEEKMKTSS